MTDSLLAVPSNLSAPKVLQSDRAAASARAKKGPKLGEHVQFFLMNLEASIALCFEWAGYLVPRDVLSPFHNIVVRTKRCNEPSCSDRIF